MADAVKEGMRVAFGQKMAQAKLGLKFSSVQSDGEFADAKKTAVSQILNGSMEEAHGHATPKEAGSHTFSSPDATGIGRAGVSASPAGERPPRFVSVEFTRTRPPTCGCVGGYFRTHQLAYRYSESALPYRLPLFGQSEVRCEPRECSIVIVVTMRSKTYPMLAPRSRTLCS